MNILLKPSRIGIKSPSINKINCIFFSSRIEELRAKLASENNEVVVTKTLGSKKTLPKPAWLKAVSYIFYYINILKILTLLFLLSLIIII
jgi:hypothetical protein